MSTEETPTGAASDDVKRKFREALEKKNAQQRSGEAHLDGESAVHSTKGPVGGNRDFSRRKSG